MSKYVLVGSTITFLVIFTLGYLFHEIIAGPWMRAKLGDFARGEYVIPLIALSFVIYTLVQAYLLNVFYVYAKAQYGWSLWKSAIVIGGLIGFLWDGLQGGIIEYATLKIPLDLTLVDSAFHTFEGCLATCVLAIFYRKFVEKLY